MYAVAYPWPIMCTTFLRIKNLRKSWGMVFWDEAPEKMFHIYIQKVFEQAKIFLK